MDIKDKAENLRDKASDFADEAGDRITKVSSKAGRYLGEKGEQFADAEQRVMKETCSYVSENPVTSIVMAAAAGFLISRVLSVR
jgi:ElaB/YqjD/DUF883 family membrane-anchored ribosome-binding protein